MHAGFNAELTDNGQIVDSAASYSLGWDSFATNICAQSHQLTNGKVVEKARKTEEFPEQTIDNDNNTDADDEDEENDIGDASKFVISLLFVFVFFFFSTFGRFYLNLKTVFISQHDPTKT